MKKILLLITLVIQLASVKGQNPWVRKTDFPGCPRYAASGFTIGTKIYIVGGRCVSTNNYLNDLWEYDINSDSWAQKDSLDYGIKYAGSFAISNKGYVFGGRADSLGHAIYSYVF